MKLDSLTGLRFFAALGVVIGHGHEHFGSPLGIAHYFALGQAVSLFFVLSGFVLTYNYNGPTFSVWNFWVARIARIWPMFAFGVLLMLTIRAAGIGLRMTTALGQPTIEYPTSDGLIRELLGVANLFDPSMWGYIVPGPINPPDWTVSVEFFFYLLFPVIVAYPWGLVAALLLWVVVTLVGVFLYATCGMGPLECYFQHAIYFANFPPFRLIEFLAGIYAARLMMRRSQYRSAAYWIALELVGVAASAFGAFIAPGLLRSGQLHPIMYSVVNSSSASLGFVLLIYACGHGRGPISKLLSLSWVRYGGEISYSLYILHYAVQTMFVHLFGQAIDPIVRSLFYLATIAAAVLAYEAIEVPCRRWIRTWLTQGPMSSPSDVTQRPRVDYIRVSERNH